jgi:hypothetical protein
MADAAAKGKAKATPAPAPKKEKETPSSQLPWALRDHYTYEMGKATVFYAVEDAQWSLTVEGREPVLDNVGFRITFADNSSLDASGLGKGSTNREPFIDATGKGTRYTSEFPPQNGLVVQHSLTVYSDRPYVLIRVGLGNTSEKPIEIAKITPVEIGPAGITHLGSEPDVSMRRLVWRGSIPVFNKDARPVLTVFHDRAEDFCLSLGVLPQGVAVSDAEFTSSLNTWHGDVVCAYNPPIRIDPGQKIEADPVWLTVNVPAPARIDRCYAWLASVMPHPELAKDVPRCWVTVEKGGSADDLLAAAKAWSGVGVKHALVPWPWVGRPGSLEGAAPAYPKDVRKVARQIEGLGMKAGLTLDPLSTTGGSQEWTAMSADGTTWLNVSVPEARSHAVERLKKVTGGGFAFFVVPPSDIPDEVLIHFNITRAQADGLAFSVMAEAAGGRPVLPSAACTVKAGLDPWLEAAVAVARLARMDVTPGPVRFDANGLETLDDATLDAMTLFQGPIEFAGKPQAGVVRQVAEILARPGLLARPVDVAKPVPKLWVASMHGAEDGYRGDAVTMFPGAGPWTLADLDRDSDVPAQVWRAADGATVDVGAGPVPPAKGFATYGVIPVTPRPILLGASSGMGLLLNDLKSLTWNEAQGVLSGIFQGSNRERATAYVAIPQGWTFKSGKVADTGVSKKQVTNRIAFPVEPGRPTHFEFVFTQK